MRSIENLPGILPSHIEVSPPTPLPMDIVPDIEARNQSFRDKALPPNHSSRDRGMQLRVSPTNRARRGNK